MTAESDETLEHAIADRQTVTSDGTPTERLTEGATFHDVITHVNFVLQGEVGVAMYDIRPESSTYRQVSKVVLSEHRRRLTSSGCWSRSSMTWSRFREILRCIYRYDREAWESRCCQE